ncbi:MAG TPA: ATP-binding protein [Micromonosporaceae bacterium]|nr:ATP-binding protein [Micromonosporaceae bacterium]
MPPTPDDTEHTPPEHTPLPEHTQHLPFPGEVAGEWALTPVGAASPPSGEIPRAGGPGGPPRPLVPVFPRRRQWFGQTLTARAVLATCVAALISVLVTALVAFPFAVRTANDAIRAGIADKATLAVRLVQDGVDSGGTPIRSAAVVRQLRRQQGVTAYLVRNGHSEPGGLPARFINAISAGKPVTGGTALIGGRRVLVEGRPIANGNGIVLIASAATATTRTVIGRLGLSLTAGLLAGLLVGVLLARRLARPIRNAARVATRLSAGDRSMRLRPEPPAEAEELAHALNDLATALAVSEGRQRDFLLSISHELRTPLTSLKGYAEALRDGVVDPGDVPHAGQTMLAEAGNLERLITDLLALARLEAAEFPVESVPVELIQLVNGTVEGWAARCAAAGVELRAEVPAVPVIVDTDPGRVRQVLDGLIENALRVVPAGAPLVLAVRGPDPVTPHHGVVEVRDGGPGFSDADLAVVFERGALYERYRGIRKVGSGLGLALAAGLVRRLGGHIEAGHAPEGGARFTVWLPTLASTRRRRAGPR